MSVAFRGTGARRVLAVLGTFIAAGAMAATANGAVLASSAFDTGTQGWKVIGDTGGATDTPTQVPTGGNPGGYVSIDDAATGGVMYWRAPNPFRTAADEAFGGRLLFSLQQSANSNPFDADDVILDGGGLQVVYNTATNPPLTPAWGKYNVRLARTGWTNVASGQPATNNDMKAVLANLDALLIRAEYHTGPDTDGLDTVSLRSKPAG